MSVKPKPFDWYLYTYKMNGGKMSVKPKPFDWYLYTHKICPIHTEYHIYCPCYGVYKVNVNSAQFNRESRQSK